MAHGTHRTIDAIAPRSRLYQGPFGRICPDLPPWSPGVRDCNLDRFFLEFANERMIERVGLTPGDIASNARIISQLEREFGSKIPAGYTYFGQFIDHDITFDPASSLMRRNDPNALLNFRTPRLDLDNVYGRGPADQPYMYDQSDPAKMAIGQVRGSRLRDLPRFGKRALIGDMRNDENSIVSNLQLAFLLAHNTLVDRARARGVNNGEVFEAAQTTLRWLYQYITWNDFVRRIVDKATHACALSLERACGGRRRWVCGLDDIYRWKSQPFMPVEFAVAAYRFGHSMVRNSYQTNQPHRGAGNFAPIFDNVPGSTGDDLRGFRPMQAKNVIQWDWFLEMSTSRGPFPQRARKIDTRLANALAFLHEGPAGDPLNVLAARNLKRGWSFDLPSGTDMARKYCLKTVPLAKGDLDALWFYVLHEAEKSPGSRGNKLGPLGSIILCAVFAGLLKGDPSSYINVAPCWKPDDDPLLCPGQDNQDDKAWTLASIIRLAGAPVDAADVARQTSGDFPDTACRPRRATPRRRTTKKKAAKKKVARKKVAKRRS